MLTIRYQWRAALGLGLVLGFSLSSRGAAAADVQVSVSCEEWGTEQVSQIEARIRAALLLDDLGARRVLIACEGSAVEVIAQSSTAQLRRPVARGPESLEDSIVQAVDLALRELQQALAQPAAPAPAPSAPPPAPAVARPPSVSAWPPAVVTAEPASLEVSLSALGERWSAHNALGAGVGASLGSEWLRYGVELGGLAALGEPQGFDVNEWHVGLRLSWTPSWLFGVRGNWGLGGSLFLTAPAGLSVDTATSLSAAFVDVGLSRPFWFGAFGLSPELALRIASAERRVRVDDVQQLVLPVLAPAPQTVVLLATATPMNQYPLSGRTSCGARFDRRSLAKVGEALCRRESMSQLRHDFLNHFAVRMSPNDVVANATTSAPP